MIEKTSGYKTTDSNGITVVHATIEAAQEAEIKILAPIDDLPNGEWPKWIVTHREELLAILKPKARKPRVVKVGRPKGSKNKTVAAVAEP